MSDYLKIMIVDDEENERNLLKVCINWPELEMEIAQEASSGIEALDMLDEFTPDIIITDICMPFMDGIEFGRLALEASPSVRIIVLTAYDEFNYAKEGIKIGIDDYLLKPVKSEELKGALLKLKSVIESERLQKMEYDKVKKQLEESLPYFKEKFLNELLHDSSMGNKANSRLEYFEVAYFKSNIQVALIETLYCDKEYTEEQSYLLRIKSTEIVRRFFGEDSKIEVFTDYTQKIVVLNGNPKIELVEYCEKIKLILVNRLKCSVSIGVGKRYESPDMAGKSYFEACEALNYKILFGKNHVVSYSDTNITPNVCNIRMDTISELCFAVKIGIVDEALAIINGIFEEFYVEGVKSVDYIRVISINIVTGILNSITELGLKYNDVFEDFSLPYNNVLKIDTVPDMIEYLKEITILTIESVKSIHRGKTNNIVKDITNYLNENISNPHLSLSGVAKTFHFNSSYLSRIFKQKTNYSFIDFITRLRIEKASSLFRTTDLKLYEVAEKVGILDPKYFSKCFKKHTGLSVNEYKRLNT